MVCWLGSVSLAAGLISPAISLNHNKHTLLRMDTDERHECWQWRWFLRCWLPNTSPDDDGTEPQDYHNRTMGVFMTNAWGFAPIVYLCLNKLGLSCERIAKYSLEDAFTSRLLIICTSKLSCVPSAGTFHFNWNTFIHFRCRMALQWQDIESRFKDIPNVVSN